MQCDVTNVSITIIECNIPWIKENYGKKVTEMRRDEFIKVLVKRHCRDQRNRKKKENKEQEGKLLCIYICHI